MIGILPVLIASSIGCGAPSRTPSTVVAPAAPRASPPKQAPVAVETNAIDIDSDLGFSLEGRALLATVRSGVKQWSSDSKAWSQVVSSEGQSSWLSDRTVLLSSASSATFHDLVLDRQFTVPKGEFFALARGGTAALLWQGNSLVYVNIPEQRTQVVYPTWPAFQEDVEAALSSTSLSADGRYLSTATAYEAPQGRDLVTTRIGVEVFDLQGWKRVAFAKIARPMAPSWGVQVSSDGKRYALSSRHSAVLFEASNGRVIHTFHQWTTWSPAERYAVEPPDGYDDEPDVEVVVRDGRTGAKLAVLDRSIPEELQIPFNSRYAFCGGEAIAVGAGSLVSVHRLRDGATVGTVDLGSRDCTIQQASLACSSYGDVAVACEKGLVLQRVGL